MNIEKLKAIFTAAAAISSPEERVAYLDAACAGDPALRAKVESLLAAQDQAGDFLETPALEQDLPTPAEIIGTHIGPYKILEQTGEGGFGVVYMAEQEQPIRRKVALKIIKAGMDTKQVIARFEAERQALALMDHPNIAKVFDAGTTATGARLSSAAARSLGERRESSSAHPSSDEAAAAEDSRAPVHAGRPYFVMELVRGIPITDFCQEKKLPLEQRLELFIQVCQAVQHAHQKGIIHRDLKPSNVMVTMVDGRPVPKVIDFGVAKAIGQKLTEKTLFTRYDQLIGTPAYMSPEQAELSGVDVDTRSDIYSLGCLLYELLTGTAPIEKETLRKAGLDEIRRLIRETDPAKPSTRLAAELQLEKVGRVTPCAPSSEAKRGPGRGAHGVTRPTARTEIEPASSRRLLQEVRGDLDWIVMKCLEKDRNRRYETANGLAMDLQRHINNEPIVACPPSGLYRFQKLVRRNTLAFAAGGAVAAALVLGLILSSWMFYREKQSRQRAEAAEQAQIQLRQEAERSRATEAQLRQEAEVARATEVRLREQAEANEQKAESESAKSQTVAQILKDMLQGVRPSIALGRDTSLLKEIVDQTAVQIGRDLAQQPLVAAELLNTLAEVYQALGQDAEAVFSQRRAVELLRASLENRHPEVARAINSLALMIWNEGEGAGVERLREEGVAMGSTGSFIENTEALRSHPSLLEAEALHHEALEIRRHCFGNEHIETAESKNNYGLVLRRRVKLDEAERLLRESFLTRKNLLGSEHKVVAATLHNLALVLRDGGKLDEAEIILREALAIRRKQFGLAHPDLATTVHKLSEVLLRKADLTAVETLFRQEATYAGQRWPSNPPLPSDPLYQVLDALLTVSTEAKLPAPTLGAERGDKDRAERNVQSEISPAEVAKRDQLVESVLTPAIQTETNNAGLLRNRAEYHSRRGRWQKAAADLRRVIQLDPDNHLAWYFLAPLLIHSGQTNAYYQHRHLMLKQFSETNLPFMAERTAKACLLLPASGADLEAAADLAQTAITVGSDHPFHRYYLFAKSLAEYRRGNYAAAVEWTQRSLARIQTRPNLAMPARAVLAMSWFQLHQTNAAQIALEDALAMAEAKSPDSTRENLDASWHDDLMTPILLGEARALIPPRMTTGLPSANFSRSEALRLIRESKWAEAEIVCRELLARNRALFSGDHELVALSLYHLGHVLSQLDRLAEAEACEREALAMARSVLDEEHWLMPALIENLGFSLQEQRKLTEAEMVLREELVLRKKRLGGEHVKIGELLNALGLVLYQQRKLADAAQVHSEALAMRRRLLGDESLAVGQSLNNLALALADQGKLQEATAMLRQSLEIDWKLSPQGGPAEDVTLQNLAWTLRRQGKLAELEALYRQTISRIQDRDGADSAKLADPLDRLVEFLITQRKHAEAEQLFDNLLASTRSAGLLFLRGSLFVRRERWKEAATDFTSALSETGMDWPAAERFLPNAQLWVGVAFLRVGDTGQYQGLCRQLAAAVYEMTPPDPNVARRYAKVLLLHPEASAELLDLAKNMLARAESASMSRSTRPWLRLHQGMLAYRNGRYGESLELLREAVRSGNVRCRANAWVFAAMSAKKLGHDEEAEGLWGLANSMAAALNQQNPNVAEYADHLSFRFGLDEAEKLFTDGCDTHTDLGTASRTSVAEGNTGWIQKLRDWLPTNSAEAAAMLDELAVLLRDQGEVARAEPLFREAIAILRAQPDSERPKLADALVKFGELLRRRSDYIEAEELFRETLQIRTELFGSNDYRLASPLYSLGLLYDAQAKRVAAELFYQQALALDRTSVVNRYPPVVGVLLTLVENLMAQGKLADAEPWAREHVELREKSNPDTWLTFNARSLLGGVLLGQKKYEAAGPLLLSGYVGMKERENKIPAVSQPRLKEALQRLVQFYEETDQHEQAAEWKQKLAELKAEE